MNTHERFTRALAAELRAIEAKRDMRRTTLVNRSGIPQRTLVRYMSGEREIPITAFLAICGALGTDAVRVFEHVAHAVESEGER